MTLVNKLIEWVFKINMTNMLSKVQNKFNFMKKNEILLIRKEFISSSFWDCRVTYPKSILSIFNYINKHDIIKKGTMRHLEHRSAYLNQKDVQYMIETREPVKLAEEIYFAMYWGEDGRLVSDNNKGDRTVEHKYSLYSYTKTMRELMDFLNSCVAELELDTINGLSNRPFYFMYDKKEDGQLHFDEYTLDNDRSFDNIFFDQKDDLKERIDSFVNNREWYRKKGIPYTLGLMFSGKPGCGKTSTIKAIAKYTKRHIIDVPLTKIDNCRDLMNIFYGEEINGKKIPMNKRIYLFEDIDTILDVLKEREVKEKDVPATNADKEEKAMLLQALMSKKGVVNSEKSKNNSADKLNLGFFLNLIDGVLETPGRILIISTNYPEKLDRALVRPGRIDMKIHMEKCSKLMIRDIVQHYYEDILDEQLSENIVEGLYSREVTPAELYQICFKYKKIRDFEKDMSGDVGILFDKYIDREEETKLQILGKMSNTMTTGQGIRRRKKGRNNPFGVNSKLLERDNGEYRESNVDEIYDKDSGSDLSEGRNIKLRDISDSENDDDK
jgi:SpoVK/Ycf46/Vps4 family AAA+-type ATPase